MNSPDYLAFVADQLAQVPGVAIRRMFGGAGLFKAGRMFGLVAGDALYFKTGDANRAVFAAAGARPFTYMRKGGEARLTSYHEVPAAVLDDPDALAEWARAAIAVADAKAAAAAPRARPKARAGPAAKGTATARKKRRR